jgi:hypothetical protein
MSSIDPTPHSFSWFPAQRFDPDFPLVFWFAGLWFYLKSFLYVCYVYMLGLDPPPYSTAVILETVYFGITLTPCLFLGAAFWNKREWVVLPAVVFLFVDTPVLVFHVLRFAQMGYLDSGLSRALEFGSLVLNIVALGWLFGYYSSARTKSQRGDKT